MVARTMDNGQWNKETMNNSKNNGTIDKEQGTRNKGTRNNSKNNGTRDKKQWEWDNKTKESNLKGTIEGLEIWYVTGSD